MQTGQREYQELLLARQGLRNLYGLTLTLTLLLALLTALSLAFVLSERLSAPLSFLAEGTRAVAQGDFSQREAVTSRDELGVLTQSFNTMRQQLAEARAVAERNQTQLATPTPIVQSILDNLSAGVLGLRRHACGCARSTTARRPFSAPRSTGWRGSSPTQLA